MKKLFILVFLLFFGNSIFSMQKCRSSMSGLSTLSITQVEKQQLAEELFEKAYEKKATIKWVFQFFNNYVETYPELENIKKDFVELVKKYFDERYEEFKKIFVETFCKNLTSEIEEMLEEKPSEEIFKHQIFVNFNERIKQYITQVINDVNQNYLNRILQETEGFDACGGIFNCFGNN